MAKRARTSSTQTPATEDDARMDPRFWPVKQALIQHFGARLPFKPLCEFMKDVRDTNRLAMPRGATRKKDIGVCWICQHWDVAEPILAQQPRCDEEQHSHECEVLANFWPKMCEIEAKLEEFLGCKPSLGELLSRAKQIASRRGLLLTRRPRRNRKFLLAWYAEHWDLIQDEVLTSPPLTEGTQPTQPQNPHTPKPRKPKLQRPRPAPTRPQLPPLEGALQPFTDPLTTIDDHWNPFNSHTEWDSWDVHNSDFADFGVTPTAKLFDSDGYTFEF
jgi:hypothetical protein